MEEICGGSFLQGRKIVGVLPYAGSRPEIEGGSRTAETAARDKGKKPGPRRTERIGLGDAWEKQLTESSKRRIQKALVVIPAAGRLNGHKVKDMIEFVTRDWDGGRYQAVNGLPTKD